MYESEIIETIVNNRGIKDLDHFLNPVEQDLLPLDALKNVDKAKEIVEKGIEDNKTFGVFFDTDSDGVSSGTIMTRYLRHYTNNIKTFINFGKAHGPNWTRY